MTNHNHGNQLDNYKGKERAAAYYEIPHVRAYVDRLVEALRTDMSLCLIPEKERVQIRDSEKRRLRCHMRPLVAYAMGREIPDQGYATPTCGNRGCVNPDHQATVVSIHRYGFNYIEGSDKQACFTRLAPARPLSDTAA